MSKETKVTLNRRFNSVSSHQIKPPQCHPNVTKIPVGTEYFALIDTADLPLVASFKWIPLPSGDSIYARSSKGGILMHRLLAGVHEAGREIEVDHRDGDGLNNRRDNFRIATRAQNLHNRARYGRMASPYKGVYPYRGKWIAKAYQSGKQFYLGVFTAQEDAAIAVDAKAIQLWGSFARLNFPHRQEQAAA